MRKVKIRILTETCYRKVWGYSHPIACINHVEEDTTYEEAEHMCGHKLDKRKNYCIIDGKVCESLEWTAECSGCDGGGCRECGGQGKVRQAMWVPIESCGGLGSI